MLPIKEKFENQLLSIEKIINSKIEFDVAKTMIDNYRAASPDTIKSIWIDNEIIDTIKKIEQFELTGIRVYFALDENNDFTTILAPTCRTDEHERHDVAYFDYGDPCLPNEICRGDIGSQVTVVTEKIKQIVKAIK